MTSPRPLAIVLIGVAGAGKTVVGQHLSDALGWAFLDADALHPRANVAKMLAGAPLTDSDRAPWLAAVRDRIAQYRAAGRPLVVACSALRQAHRDVLGAHSSVRFVYLKSDPHVIARRLARRTDHFFPPALSPSQYRTLEEPVDAITVDATRPIASIVRDIRLAMDL